MSTDFWIQASCPRWHGPLDSDATNIDEAFESVFPRDTEDAFIVWRHVYIPLSYKYDVGLILPDVLHMVEELLGADSGEWRVDWPSNTFGATWHLKWQGESMTVTANWRSVVGNTEELLRTRSTLEIGKLEFVYEWRMLLQKAHSVLCEIGYTSKALPELERLETTIGHIAASGVLYR